MLRDAQLQERYLRHLNSLIELAEKEIHRTHWDRPFRELAWMYHHRLSDIRDTYAAHGQDLLRPFREFQEQGLLEIATCAATHALLPLLAGHPPSLRAQILVARDDYQECFGRDPKGIWLPECASVEGAFRQPDALRIAPKAFLVIVPRHQDLGAQGGGIIRQQGQQRVGGGAGGDFQKALFLKLPERAQQVAPVRGVGVAKAAQAVVIHPGQFPKGAIPVGAMNFLFRQFDQAVEMAPIPLLQVGGPATWRRASGRGTG